MRPSGRSCAQAPLTSPSVQCCHLLARPALALRCLDACGAHEWGTTAYLLERARLHIQICNLYKACSILSRLLGQLQRQDFCKEHGEALVSRCAGFERPAGWLAAPAGSTWGSALCVWLLAAGSRKGWQQLWHVQPGCCTACLSGPTYAGYDLHGWSPSGQEP